jgi:hypothetical protein
MRRALIIITVIAMLLPASLALAVTAPYVPTESYATLIGQIDSGQVTSAHVNEQTHHVKVTLTDGTDQVASFLLADHKKLIDALLHHGVKPIYTASVTAAAKPKPVHHVLRYVAAGIVVVLLLIGGAVWAYTRGQSPPAAPGEAPSGPADGTSGASA